MSSLLLAQAAIADGKGGFTIAPTTVAFPQGDEILVRIKAAGICHTDWDSMSWGKPLIMGHEGAGVIAAVGPAVKGFSGGEPILLNWAIPCYDCFQCRLGHEHLCERNSAVTAGNKFSGGHATLTSTQWRGQPIERAFNLGTMSEYVLVREAACIKLTTDLPFTSAAIVGCGVMTGLGSVLNAAKVQAGSSVVVLGAGGVGLNVIQGARIAQAAQIIAIDLNAHRLQLARQFGATHFIQAGRDDQGLLLAARQVKELTAGRGADYAFECTAIPELGAAPLAMVRNAGMAVQVSGVEKVISVDMNLFEWDKLYLNPLYGQCKPQRDFPYIQQLYASGELLLDELVTRTYTLKELSTAFADMHAGKNAKGVIIFS